MILAVVDEMFQIKTKDVEFRQDIHQNHPWEYIPLSVLSRRVPLNSSLLFGLNDASSGTCRNSLRRGPALIPGVRTRHLEPASARWHLE